MACCNRDPTFVLTCRSGFFWFCFIQTEETCCLRLVIQSALRAPTVCGEVVEAEAAGASLPGILQAQPRCIPFGDKAPSLSPASHQLVCWQVPGAAYGGGKEGLHSLQAICSDWESFRNWACVHFCASHSLIFDLHMFGCMGQKSKNAGEALNFWGGSSDVCLSGCSKMSRCSSWNLQSK